MEGRDAIGIDPDSRGFICAYVKVAEPKVTTKGFLVGDLDLKALVKWVRAQEDVIVAIEGTGGFSTPLEKVLREAGIIFYSFKPADTEKFRKAVLGQNKNNRKDAESVARYAMAMEAQGRLERYRRVWFADLELQLLSRSFGRKSKEMTAEVNRLWKLLRYASPDLYLALAGNHPEVEVSEKVVKTQGILTLLSGVPDLGKWKELSKEQMLDAMGGGRYKGREKLIGELRKVVDSFPAVSPAMALMIGSSAEQILRLKAQQSQITTMLEELTTENAAVGELKSIRGLATITAASMIAEIIDIRRFAHEDNLASYSGLVMREHSTGQNNKEVHSRSFNHRLKDAFFTAARNFVLYNPDSHLTGYYRNLVKNGMSPMEATKRVARALVRVIYRRLSALVEGEIDQPVVEVQKAGEDGMANGLIRGDQSHTSDIPPSSLHVTTARTGQTVKTAASSGRTGRTINPVRRVALSKNSA